MASTVSTSSAPTVLPVDSDSQDPTKQSSVLRSIDTLRHRLLPSSDQWTDQLSDQCASAGEHMDRLVRRAYSQTEQAERIVRNALVNAWDVCHFRELPQWLQHNDYLHFGHRPPLDSFAQCFWSAFRLHTETCNIWTHVIGCIIFIAIACATLASPVLPLVDKIVFGAYLIGVIVCLALSSAYHTLSCHSDRVGQLFCRLDYCGISLLIAGSFMPCIYYGFYCDYLLTKLAYTLLVGGLCAATMLVSLCDRFSRPELRYVRVGVFFAFGVSGVLPGLHWLLAQQWLSVANLRFSLICIACMAVLYITGAALYAVRFPECFFPGKFDVWFHSHQLFHVFVIAAAIVHYQGIHGMATHRLSNMCESDPSYVWTIDPAISTASSSMSPAVDLMQLLLGKSAV
jgi:adiponectin receptor